MKNEFAISCHSFQEACDLYNEAYKHGYKYFFTGIPFTSEKFRKYKTIHFGKDDLFCIANPECLSKIYPYSKQKAIDLLSGKEQFELKIDRVNPNIEQPDYYNFIFNDNHKITCHKDNDKFITKRRPEQDSRINENEHWKLIDKWFEERRKKEEIESDLVTSVKYRGEFIEIEVKGKVTFCYSKNLWEIYLKDLNKGGKFEPNLKSAIKHYEKYIKPNLNKPKLKSISVLSAAENMGPYPCAYNAEFENGINFKFYMKSPFDYEIFSEEDSILKGEYEKAVAEFIKSKNTWPVKEISKEHKLNKPLKITAVSKKLEQKTPSGQTVPKGPIKVFAIIRYTISFNDGYTINCLYDTNNNRKKVIQSKKFTITDKHLELIYDYIDKDNNQRPFSEWVKAFDEVWKPSDNVLKFIENLNKHKFTGNEPYFSGSKQLYGKPDMWENVYKDFLKANGLSPMGKVGDKIEFKCPDNPEDMGIALKEHDKKVFEKNVDKIMNEYFGNWKVFGQQPLSHKLKASEENAQSPFVSNQEKIIDSKDSFNKEKVYELNTELSKQLYDRNKQIAVLVNQHKKDLSDWHNKFTELKAKYKKRKQLNKQDEQTIVALHKQMGEIKHMNSIMREDAKYCEEVFIELKRIFPEFVQKPGNSFISQIIDFLKTKKPENESTIIDSLPNEKTKLESFYLVLNDNIPEFKDAKTLHEKVTALQNYFTSINEKEIINDEALNKAVKKAAQKVNKDIDNFIDANDDLAKVPKQEAKPEKLIVKVGLMYKGRRVKDNKWLHGKLITIKEAGENGTVILKNDKGNHEVVYRTLIML